MGRYAYFMRDRAMLVGLLPERRNVVNRRFQRLVKQVSEFSLRRRLTTRYEMNASQDDIARNLHEVLTA